MENKDQELTLEAFNGNRIADIISRLEENSCFKLSTALDKLSGQAQQENQSVKAKMLSLLSSVCFMQFRPKDKLIPFKPMIVLDNGQSSATIDSFLENELNFFSDIVESINEPILKARLADILWLTKEPREIKYALMAMEAYSRVESSSRDLYDCYERALVLSRQTRQRGPIYDGIIINLLARLNTDTYLTNHDSAHISALLYEYLNTNRYFFEIACQLEKLADEFGENNLLGAIDLYEESIKWFARIKNTDEETRIIVKLGDHLSKTGKERSRTDHCAAKSFYEEALQTYRKVKRNKRNQYKVENRMAAVSIALNDCADASMDEMMTIRSPEIDITKDVEHSKQSVRHKSLFDAFDTFTNISIFKFDELKESAIQHMKDFPVNSMMPKNIVTNDGRTICKIPGYEPEKDDEFNKKAIEYQMTKLYLLNVHVFVKTNIIPMLEVMHLEHPIRESDFLDITRQSPIVPASDKVLFAKALYEGYCGNIAVCLHLLCPRMENLVRAQLKSRQVQTIHTDENGIQQEIGLSSLMEREEIQTGFGERPAFEINSLFCHPAGMNLRNEIAHGLTDDDFFLSPDLIYAWWFAFRMVFQTYKYVLKSSGQGFPDTADNTAP